MFQLDRYNFLIDLMVTSHKPVLITGAAGVGKTALIEVSIFVQTNT